MRDNAMPLMQVVGGTSMEEIGLNLRDMLPGMFQGRRRASTMSVPDARAHLVEEEQQKLVDMESVARTAIERVEQSGILFVDEIDKIAGREGGHGPDVSREGVQRDILPIVEGTTVSTPKHGMVRTDPSRAVHRGRGCSTSRSRRTSSRSCMRRFSGFRVAARRAGPRRVRPHPARAEKRPHRAGPGPCSPPRAWTSKFTDDAIDWVAELAALVNERMENIGARRLHTVMEKLLDEIVARPRPLGEIDYD